MLHYLNGAFHANGVPLVDAGVGSAFPYLSADQRLIASGIYSFIRGSSYCSRITVREAVAQKTFADLGVETDLIPCGALASGKIMSQIASDLTKDQYIVVNFQASGANEDWGQGVNKSEWRRIVVDVVSRLSIRHKVVFRAIRMPRRVMPVGCYQFSCLSSQVNYGVCSNNCWCKSRFCIPYSCCYSLSWNGYSIIGRWNRYSTWNS